MTNRVRHYFPDKADETDHWHRVRIGQSVRDDDYGYHRLEATLLYPDEKPILKFTTKRWAEKAMVEIEKRYDLSQSRRMNLTPDEYNDYVVSSLERYNFSEPNLLIIDQGRTFSEKSVVQIENGNYVGYGFFSTEHTDNSCPQDLISCVSMDYNHPSKEQIIRKYLKKNKRIQTLQYSLEQLD